MRRMIFKTRVRNPTNILILLQPSSESNRIRGMALTAQTKRLQPQNQLLSRKGIQRSANITQRLDPDPNSKRNGPKRLPKLQPVVALGGLDELRESSASLAPVKFAAVDDYAADRGAVAANPFCRAVHDDVRAVIDRSSKVPARTEGIINLQLLFGACSDKRGVV